MDRSQIKIEYWHDFGLRFVLSGFPFFPSFSSALLSLLGYSTEKWVRFSKLNVSLTQKPNKQNKNANNNISSSGSNTNETKNPYDWFICRFPFANPANLIWCTPVHTHIPNRKSIAVVDSGFTFFALFILKKMGKSKELFQRIMKNRKISIRLRKVLKL